MKLTNESLQLNIQFLKQYPIECKKNKLPFQFQTNLFYLHRLFVSAIYFQNKSCQFFLNHHLNDEFFDIYKIHYIHYYNYKKELKTIIRSLKFAIQYAKLKERKKKSSKK